MHPTLFREALDWLKTHPENFDMASYRSNDVIASCNPYDVQSPECGTTVCFAGICVALWNAKQRAANPDGQLMMQIHRFSFRGGLMSLGITESEAEELFYADKWPVAFATPYHNLDVRISEHLTEVARKQAPRDEVLLADLRRQRVRIAVDYFERWLVQNHPDV